MSLVERGVIRVGGIDRVGFLQGLVTNDVARVGGEWSVYGALLTPQGRFLHDFFVTAAPPAEDGSADDDAFWLDVEAARRDDLLARLRRYRLRAKVAFADLSDDFEVLALTGGGAAAAVGLPGTAGATVAFGGGVALVDPRLAGLGVRLILPRGADATVMTAIGAQPGTLEDYDRWRLELGVPDGSRDLEIERALLLEYNLDALNAIAWTKGCYVGQEVTARTRYRGLARRRLRPVRVVGPLPEPGTLIHLDDQEVGEVRSGRDSVALALLRVDLLEAADAGTAPALTAGTATLMPLGLRW
jgi:folate-binding protein YgfZ